MGYPKSHTLDKNASFPKFFLDARMARGLALHTVGPLPSIGKAVVKSYLIPL